MIASLDGDLPRLFMGRGRRDFPAYIRGGGSPFFSINGSIKAPDAGHGTRTRDRQHDRASRSAASFGTEKVPII